MPVDPHTPVIVGVGQFTERIDDDGYRGMSAVDLATEAVRAALADTGADAEAVAAAIDVFAGLRQFEISTPFGEPLLGASDNYPRSVARRVGADPKRVLLEPLSGSGPQKLVNEFAAAIAHGEAEVVLVLGSENGSSLRYWRHADDKPDHSEHIGGQLEDRGFGWEQYIDEITVAHGMTAAPVQFALMDNARRGRLGIGAADYRRAMAELFAPFSKVAAKNPYSSSPVERSVDEIMTVDDENRMIADPYPRLLVARDQVNQGAAAILMSVSAARRLGVPEEKWVYLHGHADITDQDFLNRADVGVSRAADLAAHEALRVAGKTIAEIASFDLYSCFPFSVFAFCDVTGLPVDDPRGLTLTGGLPYFGGPGNSYSLHAIGEIVNELRDKPGEFGLVGAAGGVMSKYSVGVYSTTPADWQPDRSKDLQQQIAALPQIPTIRHVDGDGVVETYTVRYDWPETTAIVIGRVDDGARFMAISTEPDVIARCEAGELLGQRISVRSVDGVNRATV